MTLTLRAFSSYIDTLYFNGFTRSVTVQAPCCDCGADPCDTVDENALINQLIDKLNQHADGLNGDNINFDTFYTFENIGGTTLRITCKPLTSLWCLVMLRLSLLNMTECGLEHSFILVQLQQQILL